MMVPAGAIDLSRGDLTARAARRTGLAEPDFTGGDETLWDRVDAQLDAINADTALTGLGRVVQQSRFTRLLANRAMLNDLLAR